LDSAFMVVVGAPRALKFFTDSGRAIILERALNTHL
jgi:hypothetical protein